MNKRFHERRKCKSYKPYMFYLLELLVYVELGYLSWYILGASVYMVAFFGLSFLYLFYKATKRLGHVINRCKISQSYKNYQKRTYQKMNTKLRH